MHHADVCVEKFSQEKQPSFSTCFPQLVLPIWRLCVCVRVRVRACGIFRVTKGSHSHPLEPPHPTILRGFTATGCGCRGRVLYLCQSGPNDGFQMCRYSRLCLMRIATMGVVWRARIKIMQTRTSAYLITYPTKDVPNRQESNERMLSSSQELQQQQPPLLGLGQMLEVSSLGVVPSANTPCSSVTQARNAAEKGTGVCHTHANPTPLHPSVNCSGWKTNTPSSSSFIPSQWGQTQLWGFGQWHQKSKAKALVGFDTKVTVIWLLESWSHLTAVTQTAAQVQESCWLQVSLYIFECLQSPFHPPTDKRKKKKAGTRSRFSAVTLQNMWNKKIWALWTHPFTWSQVKSPDHFTLKVFTAKNTKTNTRWGRAICEKKSDFWSETEQQLRLAGIKCPDIHKPQCPHFGEIIKVKPSLISALLCLWL